MICVGGGGYMAIALDVVGGDGVIWSNSIAVGGADAVGITFLLDGCFQLGDAAQNFSLLVAGSLLPPSPRFF